MDIKGALTRPLGPLPVWAWGVVIGGGYLLYKFITTGSLFGGSSTSGTPLSSIPGSTYDASGGNGAAPPPPTGTTTTPPATTPPPIPIGPPSSLPSTITDITNNLIGTKPGQFGIPFTYQGQTWVPGPITTLYSDTGVTMGNGNINNGMPTITLNGVPYTNDVTGLTGYVNWLISHQGNYVGVNSALGGTTAPTADPAEYTRDLTLAMANLLQAAGIAPSSIGGGYGPGYSNAGTPLTGNQLVAQAQQVINMVGSPSTKTLPPANTTSSNQQPNSGGANSNGTMSAAQKAALANYLTIQNDIEKYAAAGKQGTNPNAPNYSPAMATDIATRTKNIGTAESAGLTSTQLKTAAAAK